MCILFDWLMLIAIKKIFLDAMHSAVFWLHLLNDRKQRVLKNIALLYQHLTNSGCIAHLGNDYKSKSGDLQLRLNGVYNSNNLLFMHLFCCIFTSLVCSVIQKNNTPNLFLMINMLIVKQFNTMTDISS